MTLLHCQVQELQAQTKETWVASTKFSEFEIECQVTVVQIGEIFVQAKTQKELVK